MFTLSAYPPLPYLPLPLSALLRSTLISGNKSRQGRTEWAADAFNYGRQAHLEQQQQTQGEGSGAVSKQNSIPTPIMNLEHAMVLEKLSLACGQHLPGR